MTPETTVNYHDSKIRTDQWYDKWFFEAKAACDGEDWVKTGEHGSKEDDLPNARIDWEVGKVIAEGSQLLITSKSILKREKRYMYVRVHASGHRSVCM